MNCYGWKQMGFVQAGCCVLVVALLAIAPTSQAATIVDDSWTDAGRTNGADRTGYRLVDLDDDYRD